jgi:hypothetical protein
MYISIAILVSSYSLIAQNPNENAVLKEEIRQLDLAHARAIFESDAIALDRLMDDDVTVNHPTNRIVKEKEGIA